IVEDVLLVLGADHDLLDVLDVLHLDAHLAHHRLEALRVDAATAHAGEHCAARRAAGLEASGTESDPSPIPLPSPLPRRNRNRKRNRKRAGARGLAQRPYPGGPVATRDPPLRGARPGPE